MSGSATERDPLKPHQPRGMGPGLVLALLIHGLLIVAIAVGVHWRSREPEGVAAELWAAVPQIAAPKAQAPEPVPVKPEPPPPAPPPPKPQPAPPPPQPQPKAEPQPDPQIAIEKAERVEKERKKKEEAERQEKLAQQRKQEEAAKKLAEQRKREEAEKLAEKRKQEQEAKRREQAETQRLAALREQTLKRIMGQAGATGEATSTGTASRTAGPSATYAGRIRARIKPNIVFADTLSDNPTATVEVRLAPDGTIVGTRLVKSSGSPAWDDAVLRAVEKTGVLPRDVDGSVPSPMQLEFRPRD